MNLLEQELLYEFNWRISEIEIIRTIPIRCKLSADQKHVIERNSVPAIYSLYQGYVDTSFKIYVREINKQNLLIDQIHQNFITHDIDRKYDLTSVSLDFSKRVEFVNKLYDYFNSPIQISTKIPTDSNVNFRVLNKIFKIFSMKPLPRSYDGPLNLLLKIRNDSAHGEFAIPVDKEIIQEMSFLCMRVMEEVADRIVESYQSKNYLR